MVVPLDSVRFIQGELQRFATTRLSGKDNLRGFCGRCGSRLTVGEDPKWNIVGLLATSLDDPTTFSPTRDIFMCQSQPWVPLNPALPKFPQYAPRS